MIFIVFKILFYQKRNLKEIIMTKEQKDIEENKINFKKRIMHTSATFNRYVEAYTMGLYSVHCTSPCYSSIKEEMIFIHNTCGKIFKKKPRNFLGQKVRCPVCDSGKTVQRTTTTFRKLVKEISEDTYDIKSEYINDKEKVKFIHKECNTIFEMRPNNFTSGQRCPQCSLDKKANEQRYTHQDFIEKVKEIDGNTYTVLSDYVNSRDKILIKHNICGNSWLIEPACSLNGGVSKAMLKMYKFLESHNIEFTKEFVDTRCKNKQVLPFDVAIQTNNGKILLIEYDGNQHFSNCFGSRSDDNALKMTQFRDGIKNEFCKSFSNEYILERISYKQEKILNNVLFNILKKYKIIS
jgi:cytochrome c-type biogenesis protein CcmH/NrfF